MYITVRTSKTVYILIYRKDRNIILKPFLRFNFKIHGIIMVIVIEIIES